MEGGRSANNSDGRNPKVSRLRLNCQTALYRRLRRWIIIAALAAARLNLPHLYLMVLT